MGAVVHIRYRPHTGLSCFLSSPRDAALVARCGCYAGFPTHPFPKRPADVAGDSAHRQLLNDFNGLNISEVTKSGNSQALNTDVCQQLFINNNL
jgi:hypothetical protein